MKKGSPLRKSRPSFASKRRNPIDALDGVDDRAVARSVRRRRRRGWARPATRRRGSGTASAASNVRRVEREFMSRDTVSPPRDRRRREVVAAAGAESLPLTVDGARLEVVRRPDRDLAEMNGIARLEARRLPDPALNAVPVLLAGQRLAEAAAPARSSGVRASTPRTNAVLPSSASVRSTSIGVQPSP